MTPARRLLYYFERYRGTLLLGALTVIGSSIFSLAKPLIVGRAVDALTRDLSSAGLVRYASLFVAAAAVQGIFLFLQRWIVIGASRRIEFDMRNDFYGHLQKLPPSFYQEHRTGDLVARASNDLSAVRMLIGPAVMHSFSSLLVVVGAFVMMLGIDRNLALIALCAVPVVAGIVKQFGEQIHERFRSVQDFFGEISARVQENLAGVRVVRAFAQETNEIERFKAMNREYVERNRSLIRLSAIFYPLLHAVIGFMFVIIFFFGSRKILAGSLTIGSFVAFQFYLGRMIWPLIAIGWVINLFERGMASMKRMNEVWNVAPEESAAGESSIGDGSGEIEVRDLSFGYSSHPVLQNVSFKVAPGTTLGIVGRTGSGKSTLLSLISRAVEPPSGSILIDGRPVESIPKAALREMIGIVPQETFLFSDTIAENIRFGRSSATDDDVENVSRLAGLSGDLVVFPQGVETMIGERGITLSGGQKQRTAIARALIRNPVILILDDSLSAVDTDTEERILKSLRSFRRGRTALVVSHRVSSVKDADEIIVLEQGRVVERGSHDELLLADGYYSDLYRRQTLTHEIEEIA